MKPHTGPWHYTAGDNDAREKARLAGELPPDPPEEPTLRGEITAAQTECERIRRHADTLTTQMHNIGVLPSSNVQYELALTNLRWMRQSLGKLLESLATIDQLAQQEGR